MWQKLAFYKAMANDPTLDDVDHQYMTSDHDFGVPVQNRMKVCLIEYSLQFVYKLKWWININILQNRINPNLNMCYNLSQGYTHPL